MQKFYRSGFLYFAPILIIVVLLAVPLLSSAAGLVPCDGPDCTFCHLILLAQKIMKFLIYTLALPIATVLFAWAGILYITAGGNTGQVGRAKKIFTDVLLGLIIAVSAALVIDLIMRTFTGNDLRFWTDFNCEAPLAGGTTTTTTTSDTTGTTATGGMTVTGGTTGATACLDCITLTGVTVSPNACSPPSSSCTVQLHTIVATQVQTMDSALRAQGLNLRVTEGYPPTVTHRNPCHQNGTCLDYNFLTSYPTPTQVATVISEASNAGLRAVYEIPSGVGANAQCNTFINAGVPRENIVLIQGISTSHFSIYSPGLSNGSGTPCT